MNSGAQGAAHTRKGYGHGEAHWCSIHLSVPRHNVRQLWVVNKVHRRPLVRVKRVSREESAVLGAEASGRHGAQRLRVQRLGRDQRPVLQYGASDRVALHSPVQPVQRRAARRLTHDADETRLPRVGEGAHGGA